MADEGAAPRLPEGLKTDVDKDLAGGTKKEP
jgi:hypothetical protein